MVHSYCLNIFSIVWKMYNNPNLLINLSILIKISQIFYITGKDFMYVFFFFNTIKCNINQIRYLKFGGLFGKRSEYWGQTGIASIKWWLNKLSKRTTDI